MNYQFIKLANKDDGEDIIQSQEFLLKRTFWLNE